MRTLERRTNQPEHAAPPSLTRRLLWFIGLWTASIIALGVIAYGIRFWLGLS